ncbi:unnamed protein product [Brassica oleracea var. botrytis]
MEFLSSVKDSGLLTTYSPRSFLLEPLLLRWVSGVLHMVLLLALFCSWVRNKSRGDNWFGVVRESPKDRRGFRFNSVLFCSLALSLLNLVLMSLSCFYLYESGWSDNDQLVSLVGFLLATVSWGTLSICLHRCSKTKPPFLLRLWLVLYLVVSCYFLVVDIVMYEKDKTLHVLLPVYDIVSFSAALFLSYVAFLKKARGSINKVLEEPLLNGDSSVDATPYSRAGILSLLTFSWMSPLIETGNKKALDLEDVPELHVSDSVVKLAPNFRSMLESSSDGGGVTTFKLLKALFFSSHWEILVTAFFAFIYTIASYVGPALIDTFVQYLNGRRQYNNEGYVLVITFFLAKLLECLAKRRWYFRLQKIGIRMRSCLVAMIYEKGLTLSCHSKKGRTSGEIINFMTVDAERVGSFCWYIHDSWLLLLQIGLAMWLLYMSLGLASIAALVATFLVMLVNIPFGKMQERFQEKLMEAKDSRMKSTSEILRNMRILKLQGWEMKFLSKTASTDQSAVDLDIPYQFSSLAVTAIQVIGIIGVMSQVSWLVFLVFIPVVAASIWYQRYYIAAARELSRLDGVCKAPLIQHFSETISGSTTIRSFNQESRFRGDNMRLSDAYSRPKFYLAGAVEWLCFRLDMLSSLVFVFSLIFLISIPTGVIDPSLAGLAVTYGLNLNTQQAWLVWGLCNLENKIISVERILQYASVPSEPPLVLESNRPEHSWPSLGDVDIRDLQVRYAAHMPLVLRGITCTFKGGLRTGIVGRTGSGKSTLIQTLFRIVEPSAGEIMIDGVNILTIGLHDLRLRLSIIPQDPTMFEGTVRSNLDPLEEYTDDQIWEALDKCQLGDAVRKKEHKLDSSVSENGENWSMGQRQLVCLGRVLLKRSNILVLDEATASVDTATDNLIQKTLREHFSDCTVITIAHRISSVIDSDMVLLLSNGIIEEYDSPVRLLEDKSSSFAKLVSEYTARSSSD